MKTSIIQTLIVALAAGVQVTEACALYLQCRCTMADGSINNTITEAACTYKLENTQGAQGDGSTAFQPSTDSNGTTWCNNGRNGKAAFFLNNCSFRDACTASGATGSDSWCQEKDD